MVMDRVPPSRAVAEISSDVARKLSDGVRSWFGVQADVSSVRRVYRELTINHESMDQRLWQSEEHFAPEYVLLYDLPAEIDDTCKKIANLGHDEHARQTVERLQQELEEEKKTEVSQAKGKKKNGKRKAKGKTVDKMPIKVEEKDKDTVIERSRTLRLELERQAEEKDAVIAKLQLDVERYREGEHAATTLAAKTNRILKGISRRNLLNEARTKLYKTYDKIPPNRLVIRDRYKDGEYENELRDIVKEVLSVLTDDHKEILHEDEIRMIVDGRKNTVRGDGNVAAHGSHVDDSVAINDCSVLTDDHIRTLGSISRFMKA